MIEYPPDILLHENVLGFPHEKMAQLLGQFFREYCELFSYFGKHICFDCRPHLPIAWL